MKRTLIICMILYAAAGHAQEANKMTSKGNIYYEAGQYDAAEQQYRKALTADPKNETAMYNLSNALQKQKKYDDAVKILEQLTGVTKRNNIKAAAFYNQGVAYTQQKDLDASIEAYKKSLRIDPADKEARENLELALREQKKQQQNRKQQQNQQSKMSQKEADQKLQLLSQREKELQQRLQNQSKQSGGGQALDW